METFFVKRQGAGEPDIFEEEITVSFKEVAVGVSVDDSAAKQRPFPIGRDVDVDSSSHPYARTISGSRIDYYKNTSRSRFKSSPSEDSAANFPSVELEVREAFTSTINVEHSAQGYSQG